LNIHYAMGNFIRDGLNGGPIRIGGDGTPYRSYLYVSDMVTWLWKILVNGKSNRPYNVGSNVGISISDTASAVNRAFGNSYSILVAGKAMPGQPGSRYVPNVERICKELGVVARVDLEDGIRRTVLWYRNCGTRAL